jgi:hypothetical protein
LGDGIVLEASGGKNSKNRNQSFRIYQDEASNESTEVKEVDEDEDKQMESALLAENLSSQCQEISAESKVVVEVADEIQPKASNDEIIEHEENLPLTEWEPSDIDGIKQETTSSASKHQILDAATKFNSEVDTSGLVMACSTPNVKILEQESELVTVPNISTILEESTRYLVGENLTGECRNSSSSPLFGISEDAMRNHEEPLEVNIGFNLATVMTVTEDVDSGSFGDVEANFNRQLLLMLAT